MLNQNTCNHSNYFIQSELILPPVPTYSTFPHLPTYPHLHLTPPSAPTYPPPTPAYPHILSHASPYPSHPHIPPPIHTYPHLPSPTPHLLHPLHLFCSPPPPPLPLFFSVLFAFQVGISTLASHFGNFKERWSISVVGEIPAGYRYSTLSLPVYGSLCLVSPCMNVSLSLSPFLSLHSSAT